uniref:Selenoprotein F n=1 Tax=Hucho hucho TaxID=62062 RepID=A0A4W5RQ58_9TELE
MSGEVYILWLLSLIQTLSACGADLSSEACRELGFSSNLLCSSCDLLGEFSLGQIQPVCRQCCQQEAQMESRKVRRLTAFRVSILRVSIRGRPIMIFQRRYRLLEDQKKLMPIFRYICNNDNYNNTE